MAARDRAASVESTSRCRHPASCSSWTTPEPRRRAVGVGGDMRRRWVVRMAIALALGMVALATSTPRAQETVKIGLPVPLTGFVAESAREMVEGFQLYLEESGQKLGGLPIQVVIEDTEAQPQNALTKMRKLVEQDKVNFVVGYLLAFEGYAVRDYVHQKKVPLFLPIVAADDLTQRQRSP